MGVLGICRLHVLSHYPTVLPAGPVKSLSRHGLLSAKVRSINTHESQAWNKDKGQQGFRAMRAMNRNWPESVRWRVLVSVDVPCGHSLGTPCRSPTCVRVCVAVHVCTCVHGPMCVSFVVVWWRVQCAAGGPGWISKERGENQRAGGADPNPAVPGKYNVGGEKGGWKSPTQIPMVLQSGTTLPRRDLLHCLFYASQKSMKRRHAEDLNVQSHF